MTFRRHTFTLETPVILWQTHVQSSTTPTVRSASSSIKYAHLPFYVGKSNQKNLGMIESSNLCTEIIEYSAPDKPAICNLASLSIRSSTLSMALGSHQGRGHQPQYINNYPILVKPRVSLHTNAVGNRLQMLGREV